MKSLILTLVGLIAIPAVAMADFCSDLTAYYDSLLQGLSNETEIAQVIAERDAVLAASGCTMTPPPPPKALSCEELTAVIKAEAQRLAAEDGRGFSAGAKYVESKKAEIEAACGNFGRGRHLIGGNPADERKTK